MTWPDDLTAGVGRRVAIHRKRARLTAGELSEQLAAMGIPMKRTVISNLELGYRRTVSLPEVLAIAYILRIPPLLLMVPLGQDEEFAVLPDSTVDTWTAARWITGEGDGAGWNRPDPDTTLMRLLRKHSAEPIEGFSSTNT